MTPRPAFHGARAVTRSARATFRLGERLGRALRPGDVVALVGDLGAGKTLLVRGACRGARVPDAQVASPSFAIVAAYQGRLPVHHADLYRVADLDELQATGFGDLVGGEAALLVEWADRCPGALPEERLSIRLSHRASPNERAVEITGTGERHAALARRIAAPARSRPVSRPRSRPVSRSRSRSATRPRSRPH